MKQLSLTILQRIKWKTNRILKLIYVFISNNIPYSISKIYFPNNTVYEFLVKATIFSTIKQFRQYNEHLLNFITNFKFETNLPFVQRKKLLFEELKKEEHQHITKYLKTLGVDLFTDLEKKELDEYKIYE